jgi:hypothetical protein
VSIVNKIIGKVGSFLAGCSYMDLAILGVIVLIPVLAIILAIATGASRKRRVDRLYVDRRASRPVRRRKKNRYEDTYYLPRKHRVRYIKTMKPRGRKQVKVQRVYGEADQSAMLATGLFGVGLGVMAYKAAIEEKRKFYM